MAEQKPVSSARRRYEVAFLAAGWLLLIGILFQRGAGTFIRSGFDRVQDRLSAFGQSLSDKEGETWERVQHQSRKDSLRSAFGFLDSKAALEKPPAMLFGAFDGEFPSSFQGFNILETQLRYRFPLISFYQAWGDKPDESRFPTRMVETIDRLGSVPMITWEPWVTDFDATLRTNLPPASQRDYASLAAIAHGDYDFYIVPWAQDAAKYGKPLFLRFAHEMNDPYRYPWGPQNGNRPEDFIAAWKHVHLLFQKMNANNVLWVWAPHISMPWFEYYYPGDEWVDWVGTGILNYGDVAPWSRWWSFHQILEKAYPTLAALHKPIMITEFGTLASGGDPVDWYEHAFFDMKEKYPAIRAVVLFNQTHDVTLSGSPLNWSPLQSTRAAAVVREALFVERPSVNRKGAAAR